jgi:hypothetical protein
MVNIQSKICQTVGYHVTWGDDTGLLFLTASVSKEQEQMQNKPEKILNIWLPCVVTIWLSCVVKIGFLVFFYLLKNEVPTENGFFKKGDF